VIDKNIKTKENIMSKVMTPSVFCMEDVNSILKMSINEAKLYVVEKIKSRDNIKNEGKAKIIHIVNTTRNILDLATRVSNFILAHPEHDLKVIKPGC
jgi:hypothetical protein